MFGKQVEGHASLRSIKKFLGHFPFYVTFLTFLNFRLILVSPPDSLHRGGGICSRSGTQSR